MRKIVFAIACALAVAAGAHELEIPPVTVELRIEPDQIRAKIESLAGVWVDQLLSVPMSVSLPASNWPEKYQSAAKDYVSKYLRLRTDGRELTPDRFECRLIQEPFKPTSARVVFEVRYPTGGLGKTIAGRAQFFQEYWERVRRESSGAFDDAAFVTNLHVIGKKEVRLTLPFQKPDFEFPAENLVLTQTQRRMERVQSILFRVVSSVFFWIALVAIGYRVYARFFKRRED